jgi:hypothetical protein
MRTVFRTMDVSFLWLQRHKGTYSGGTLLFLWFLASDDRQYPEFQTTLSAFRVSEPIKNCQAGYTILYNNICNILSLDNKNFIKSLRVLK